MSPQDLFWTGAVLALATLAIGALWRLHWSPLAAVPGPKLAAVTYCYELYFDLVAGARFPWKLQELHHRYGPIVRISPTEVHIDDPTFASTHFASTHAQKKHKLKSHENDFGAPNTIHSTADADTHRHRQRALAPLFTKRAVLGGEKLVQQKVDLVCEKVAATHNTEEAVDLRLLFHCMGNDVLSEYAFPSGINFLGQSTLDPAWRDVVVDGGLRKFHYFKHFHYVMWPLAKAIPPKTAARMMPHLKIRVDWAESNRAAARTACALHNGVAKVSGDPSSVFDHLLRSDLPFEEKEFERIWQEATALLGAGTETISNVLSTTLFYILESTERHARLKCELSDLEKEQGALNYDQLEKLPYLSAVINEGLRIAYGITARLSRVTYDSSIIYSGFTLPAGTTVSMSAMLQHRNTSVFPYPDEFHPERWLEGSADKNDLLTFSKGSRQCLGISLAYMELYLAIGTLIHQLDLELFQTTLDDVTVVADGFQPINGKESRGVRVRAI